MKIKFNRPCFYLSHSIEGHDGDVIGNCQRAQTVLRKLEKCYPDIKWYVPGRFNLVIDILHKQGSVTVPQILEADCEILRSSHAWAWWYTGPSQGCQLEANVAEEIGLLSYEYENIIYTDLTKASYSKIRRIFNPLVETAIQRFREQNVETPDD